jgi:hypothetical protein
MEPVHRGAIRDRWTVESDLPPDPAEPSAKGERDFNAELGLGILAESRQRRSLERASESIIVLATLVLLGLFLVVSFFNAWGAGIRSLMGGS